MKNIFFITALLLGNQFAFGMYNGTVKTIPNHPEIRTINYVESGNYKGYCATLKNGDQICADFFVAGPYQGSFHCVRSTYNKRGFFNEIQLNNNVYHELRALYEAQNH